MDKNEYRAKLDEINDLVDRQDYKGALKAVDAIDWRRVRSARTLCMVGEIYEANKRYEDSRKLLLMAHHRAPIGRTVLYRLVELSIKMGNFDEAEDYYKQFAEISPNDNSRYILKYKLARARRAPIEEQISILQEYKSREYTERWAYELARLYAKAGKKEACIEECDDLILWFSEGKYVTKAMELKMKYTLLTPIQQDKYNHRFQKGYVPGTAAKAAAAAKAAESLAKASASAESSEIDDIIKSVVGEKTSSSGPQTFQRASAPPVSDTQELKDKVAQEILDVLPGRNGGEEETAVTEEPAEKKGYIVKELEPETFEKAPELKPFHMEGMKPSVKVQAPQSRLFKEEDMNPEDFRTDFKEKELDLETLLAETASELAQAVAEETKGADTTAVGPEFTPKEERPEEESGAQHEIPAPAAAKSVMVADAIASALMEKAEEFEKDAKKTQEALGDTKEIATEEILEATEAEAEEASEEIQEPVEENEEVVEESQEPVEEAAEAAEESQEAVEEAAEAPEEFQESVEEAEEAAEESQEAVEEAEEAAEEPQEAVEEVEEAAEEPQESVEEVEEAAEEPQEAVEEAVRRLWRKRKKPLKNLRSLWRKRKKPLKNLRKLWRKWKKPLKNLRRLWRKWKKPLKNPRNL